ncbi:MAG TPA: hypothetical protein VGH44_04385 [Candidatus Saccharimonadia bacterium]
MTLLVVVSCWFPAMFSMDGEGPMDSYVAVRLSLLVAAFEVLAVAGTLVWVGRQRQLRRQFLRLMDDGRIVEVPDPLVPMVLWEAQRAGISMVEAASGESVPGGGISVQQVLMRHFAGVDMLVQALRRNELIGDSLRRSASEVIELYACLIMQTEKALRDGLEIRRQLAGLCLELNLRSMPQL